MQKIEATEDWENDVFGGLERLERESVLPEAEKKPSKIKAIVKTARSTDFERYAQLETHESIPPRLA